MTPNFTRLAIIFFIAALPLGCATTPPPGSSASFPLTIYDDDSGVWVPADPASRGNGAARLPQADRLAYQAVGPYPVALDRLPPQAVGPDLSGMVELKDKGRIEKPIPEEAAARLRAEALLLPPTAMVQRANDATGPGPQSPATGNAGFDSLDYIDCCDGGGNVPADSELAVGPNHIIAVVNVAFEIYDKSGNLLSEPTTFSDFFSGVPNCSNVFDPNVIYDEAEDQFILAIDGNGKDYCIAATQPSDSHPLNWVWNRYSFATDVGRKFFDYPLAGVGDDEIYMGANMFGRRFFSEGRVWAIDKYAMYNGATSLSVVTHSTGGESTPQPMNLHGAAQGTWPDIGEPHYILTDGPYNGAEYGVWSWTDPFGADNLVNQGTVNLNTATGVTAGAPVDAPQYNSNIKLDGNDWRVQDAEYRNGYIWMADTIACNPGGGTVDCVRWAQIDPRGGPQQDTPTILNAGVYGSAGDYRIFADLAADDCNNMAIGYTRTSTNSLPSVYVSGRESGDDVGTLQSEVLVKAGEIEYDSFQSGTTHRWGDYTAMTVDPDGRTFWYMGQYSKNTGTINGRWGNWIAPFSFTSCADLVSAPGQASNPSPSENDPDVTIEASLSWTAGTGAASHEVFFGEGDEFTPKGIQSSSTFFPATLLKYATTYKWRIDEVNSAGTTRGEVWSFTTEVAPPVPGKATDPSPQNPVSSVSISAALSWTADSDATSHDVYFGVDGANLESRGNQTGTSYGPGTLNYDTPYYWRIDEVNSTATTTGDVWSFTTKADSGGGGSTLVGSSINNGRTWTAEVTDTNVSPSSFGGDWLIGGSIFVGCTDVTTCTLSGIAKKQGSVIFIAESGEEITILKP